jgi:hypothetical protein
VSPGARAQRLAEEAEAWLKLETVVGPAGMEAARAEVEHRRVAGVRYSNGLIWFPLSKATVVESVYRDVAGCRVH